MSNNQKITLSASETKAIRTELRERYAKNAGIKFADRVVAFCDYVEAAEIKHAEAAERLKVLQGRVKELIQKYEGGHERHSDNKQ